MYILVFFLGTVESSSIIQCNEDHFAQATKHILIRKYFFHVISYACMSFSCIFVFVQQVHNTVSIPFKPLYLKMYSLAYFCSVKRLFTWLNMYEMLSMSRQSRLTSQTLHRLFCSRQDMFHSQTLNSWNYVVDKV